MPSPYKTRSVRNGRAAAAMRRVPSGERHGPTTSAHRGTQPLPQASRAAAIPWAAAIPGTAAAPPTVATAKLACLRGLLHWLGQKARRMGRQAWLSRGFVKSGPITTILLTTLLADLLDQLPERPAGAFQRARQIRVPRRFEVDPGRLGVNARSMWTRPGFDLHLRGCRRGVDSG